MIGVDDLLELILTQARPLPVELLATGLSPRQVLAADLIAVDPVPPFDNSAMDGYAVRRTDLGHVEHFQVAGEVAAGQVTVRDVARGVAIAIATGAPLPKACDAVVPLEQAQRSGDLVRFVGQVPEHGHVRRAGEDVPSGAIVARAGASLDLRLVALAEAAGVSRARVRRRPSVAVLTTGDELIDPRADLGPGAVRDVNGLLLTDALRAMGVDSSFFGRFPDDPDRIATQLSARHLADAVVITGGLGGGRKDVVTAAVKQAGTVRAFDVAMRPGKDFAFGRVAGKPVYCLPGNPGAALAAFHALVAPALRVLSGRPPHPPTIQAVLTEPLSNAGGRRHYVRATLAWNGPTLAATPTGRQGSGLVSDIVAADGLLVVPEATKRVETGDVLEVLPLKSFGGS